jgi:hypothetical protein
MKDYRRTKGLTSDVGGAKKAARAKKLASALFEN